MASETDYLSWQKRLASSKPFRYFWQFWSNYAFVFFGIAGLIIVVESEYRIIWQEVLVLSVISFVAARGLIVTAINAVYKRARPYQKYNFDPITSKFFSFKTKIANSFPSRHATAYFSVSVVVAIFVPALGAALLIASVLTGMARIILGYHWPSDIMVGAILGSVVGILTVYIGYSAIFT